jgi:hypothetical protein
MKAGARWKLPPTSTWKARQLTFGHTVSKIGSRDYKFQTSLTPGEFRPQENYTWIFFKALLTPGKHHLILFSLLEEKALEEADEKDFCTSVSSKQHCDELSANKSGSDELHFSFKIQN